MGKRLILASASLRRRKIMAELGVEFDVEVPDVEEICLRNDPRETVYENAGRKIRWAGERWPDRWIVAADTVVGFGGAVVNKPKSLDAAREMFRAFSGATHEVLTAVAFRTPAGPGNIHVEKSTVRFRHLTEEVIERYFAEVDPLDKAGGYDINQRADEIISEFSGSRTNIMGLPSEVVKAWLAEQGMGVSA